MRNEVLIQGQLLDLDDETNILPTFQANNLTQPDKINSDTTPEFSVPGTTRNHYLLGQAAYGTSPLTRAYKRTEATLRSNGVETMPRAILIIKGFNGGRYQLQLVAGNRRFVEALGEKKLRELDFSRYNHLWTLETVASRCSPQYYAQHGWSYELFDRGKPLDLDAVSPFVLYPSLSARLVFEQMLTEAGFSASDWGSPVLDRLSVAAAQEAVREEAFRKARRLVVGIGPGKSDGSGQPSANRDTVELVIPFNDAERRSYYTVPTVAGIYQPEQFYGYRPDEAVYLQQAKASTVAQIYFSDIRIGKVAARIRWYIDGVLVHEGLETTVAESGPLSVASTVTDVLLQAGQKLTAAIRLRGVPNQAGETKWGYVLFDDREFDGLERHTFDITVSEKVPPTGVIRLQEWLPDMSQLDFFKVLVQVGGLTVQTDDYEDLLELSPSAMVLLNTVRARDWTAKRDQPAPSPSEPRDMVPRFGSYGQRNLFKWREDETVSKDYGNGILRVADAVLPREYVLTTLPFAATEPSTAVAGLLRIANFQLQEDTVATEQPVYTAQTVQPRLVLRYPERRLPVTLRMGPHPGEEPQIGLATAKEFIAYRRALALYNQQAPAVLGVSYFTDEAEPVELDAERYLLPVAWRGLSAMLTEARYLTEQYRLTEQDVQELDYTIPIWDGGLGDFFAISKVGEFDSSRPTVVELARLHPSFLPAPATPEAGGKEFYQEEFYSPSEAY